MGRRSGNGRPSLGPSGEAGKTAKHARRSGKRAQKMEFLEKPLNTVRRAWAGAATGKRYPRILWMFVLLVFGAVLLIVSARRSSTAAVLRVKIDVGQDSLLDELPKMQSQSVDELDKWIMTISDLHRQLERPGWGCQKVIRAYMSRIKRFDSQTRAVVQLVKDGTIDREVKRVAKLKAKGGPLSLYCVPVLVKDNIAVQGLVNAAGSAVLEEKLGPSMADAPSILQLRQQGAIILGKTNMDEFALSFRTLSSRGGQTRNVFRRERYPGGSSGGSAVAVAAGFAILGVGTDTGGSVRIPSSFAGLVGVRPTHGLVALAGVVPLSHSRDTVGVMASSVADAALGLDVLRQKSSGDGGGNYDICTRTSKKPIRVGLARFMFPETSSPQRKALDKALRKLDQATLNVDLVNIESSDLQKAIGSLGKHKSTSYYEFENDFDIFIADQSANEELTLARVAQLTSSSKCKSKISEEECQQIRKNVAKKLHKDARLSRKEANAHTALLGSVTQSLQKTVSAAMSAQGLDLIMYPTFKHLPDLVSKGSQQYCGNNRLAPALLWPALSLPLTVATNEGLPQGVDILARAGQECLLFKAASEIQAALKVRVPRPFFL